MRCSACTSRRYFSGEPRWFASRPCVTCLANSEREWQRCTSHHPPRASIRDKAQKLVRQQSFAIRHQGAVGVIGIGGADERNGVGSQFRTTIHPKHIQIQTKLCSDPISLIRNSYRGHRANVQKDRAKQQANKYYKFNSNPRIFHEDYWPKSLKKSPPVRSDPIFISRMLSHRVKAKAFFFQPHDQRLEHRRGPGVFTAPDA